jgi:hypothetical protein
MRVRIDIDALVLSNSLSKEKSQYQQSDQVLPAIYVLYFQLAIQNPIKSFGLIGVAIDGVLNFSGA